MQDPSPSTHYASPQRIQISDVSKQRDLFLSAGPAKGIIDASDDVALVLNEHRQIVYANPTTYVKLGSDDPAKILGLRPGEAVGCQNASLEPGGCGTSQGCCECGAAKAIVRSLSSQGSHAFECRILTGGGRAFDFLARAKWIAVSDTPFVILFLRDISADKRRDALERTFLHDAMNTISGIRGLAEMLQFEHSRENMTTLVALTEQLVEEVRMFRELVEAEKGALRVHLETLQAQEVINGVKALLSPLAQRSQVELASSIPVDFSLRTDATLIRRVLVNLTKNALEASSRGEQVRITARLDQGRPTFEVHNNAHMSKDVQLQVFQRSFSTKGGSGRGLGTYSAKLLTESFLRGVVFFESHVEDGTTFTVRLPAADPA